MDIICDKISKRYGFDWIFKDITFHFKSGSRTGITGRNGSGKSTLLRILMGANDPSKGAVEFLKQKEQIPVTNVYSHVAFAAPYLGLPDNFTITEIINYYKKFKSSYVENWNHLPSICRLEKHTKKQVSKFSSGMKQRLKLGLAILSVSDVLILDEPSTNLDQDSKAWMKDLVSSYSKDRTIIIASNESFDLSMCDQYLNIMDYKK